MAVSGPRGGICRCKKLADAALMLLHDHERVKIPKIVHQSVHQAVTECIAPMLTKFQIKF